MHLHTWPSPFVFGGLLGFLLPAISTSVDPLEEFYTLEDQMAEAHEKYMEALHALEEKEEGPAGQQEPPPDPRPAILKKMDALADAALGQPGGATIAVGAFSWSWILDLDLDHLPKRFERLVRQYPNAPETEDAVTTAGDAGQTVGSPDAWIKAIKQLIGTTKREETKRAGLFALGHIQLSAKRLSQAKEAFQTVIKAAPDSDLAEAAKGYIYEIDNLQPGMVAPDFVAKTIEGKEIPLRSLRGKAVLLNFWASW